MESRTRKILLLIFSLIFVIAAPILILYFQGYRFDFENRKITQTGAFFCKTLPKQIKVYIDGKLVKQTDFFFGNALVEELLPKKYNFKLQKDNYFDWEKNLEIKEKEVTAAKNIILFPKEINFSFFEDKINNIWISPDEKRIVLEEENNDSSWSLKLYDLQKSLKSSLLNEKDISIKKVDLFDVEFSEDGQELYFEVGVGEQLKEYSLEIEKTPPLLKEREITPLPLENIAAYQEINGNVYYLDNLGYLYKTDQSFLNKEKISTQAFPVQQETEYKIDIFSDFIFLREKGENLYLFNKETKAFEKLADGIISIKPSPDRKKLLYFSPFEINLFFLENNQEPVFFSRGSKMFLIRISDKINNVFWLNSNYLIFYTDQAIKIAEIDNRDRVNVIDIANFASIGSLRSNPENDSLKKIFWNENEKKIYVLIKNILWSSEKIIP